MGGNPSYPNDKGFAIKPWQKCSIRNQVIQLHGDLAITMGNVDLADSSGKMTTVEKPGRSSGSQTEKSALFFTTLLCLSPQSDDQQHALRSWGEAIEPMPQAITALRLRLVPIIVAAR